MALKAALSRPSMAPSRLMSPATLMRRLAAPLPLKRSRCRPAWVTRSRVVCSAAAPLPVLNWLSCVMPGVALALNFTSAPVVWTAMMTAPLDPGTLTLASSSDWRTVKLKLTGWPAESVPDQVSLGEVKPASQCAAVPS